MLRDEGGRIADEESQVHIGAAPPAPKGYDFDFDDEASGAAARARMCRRSRRSSSGSSRRTRTQEAPDRRAAASQLPLPPRATDRCDRRRCHRPPREGTDTAAAAHEGHHAVAAAARAQRTRAARRCRSRSASRRARWRTTSCCARCARRPAPAARCSTSRRALGDVDARCSIAARAAPRPASTRRSSCRRTTEPSPPPTFDDEATRMANVDSIGKRRRRRHRRARRHDERTRAVDIRNDPSISDIDWDID